WERVGDFPRIHLAQREWEANNLPAAEKLLDECPSEFRQWEWNYLKGLCHSELLTLSGFVKIFPNLAHDHGVESVAFESDRIAALSVDGVFKMWDAATGVELPALGEQSTGIGSIAFNRSGTR